MAKTANKRGKAPEGYLHRRLEELEDTHLATLNILEDFDEEKARLKEFQQATLNLLADFDEEKSKLIEFQRATMNILEDFDEEKARLKAFPQATMNLLEDFDEEKARLKAFQQATANILEDMYEEKNKLDDTQRALLNILDDVEAERNQAEQSRILLESVNEELEAFSYSVSHDLRAPLRAVSGFAVAVQEDYASRLDEEGIRYLELIAQNARKMSRLIDDLLAFSRIGRREMTMKEIDLRTLAEEVFGELVSQIAEFDIDFKIGDVPPVYGDESMIRQVLINFFANAIKFTRPVTKAFAAFGYDPKKGAYYIKDNGVGFDMKYSGKLFGVFQRLHAETEFEGTGVGLALVHRIITRHGGKVWAQSQVGQGATFFFTLPERRRGFVKSGRK